MKKGLLTFMLLWGMTLSSLAQNALTYVEPLTITVNGNATKQDDAAVTVIMNADGTIDLTLRNFELVDGDDHIPVGHIAVTGLALTPSGDGMYMTFERTETITIIPGDPEVSPYWLADNLPPIPIVMRGELNYEHVYATLDIDLQESLQQMVYVVVGAPLSNGVEQKYVEPLTITVNGNENKQDDAGVTVMMHDDGTIDLTLRNFELVEGADHIPVGHIAVRGLELTPSADGMYMTFERTETITIMPGDPEVSPYWLADNLPPIPIVMRGELNYEHVYATLDIDLQESLQQVVYVVVGTPLSGEGEQGEEDGIKLLRQVKKNDAPAVDLSGRRVAKGKERGIVIVNGRLKVKG